MAPGTASATSGSAVHDTADALEQGTNNLFRRRHAGGQQAGEAGGGNAGKEEPAPPSVEQAFADLAVPSWREQLTVRAFVVGSLLAVVFNVILMKINLAMGINPSLNICASLLSYLLPRPRLDQAHRELRLCSGSPSLARRTP